MVGSTATNFVKTALALVGALALALIVFGGVTLYRQADSKDRRDSASPKDVRHILNWASLPAEQKFEVVHSFQSARSFTGDHVDAYCISLEKVTLDDDWGTADTLEKPFFDAVAFGLDFAAQDLPCLPSSEDLTARKILIKPFSLQFYSAQPGAGEVILLDPETKELYFVSFKV